MKKNYTRLRAFLLALAFGLASAGFFQPAEIDRRDDLSLTTIVGFAPPAPKFAQAFRGCGMGYVQGYVTPDGIELNEGSLGCRRPRKNDPRIVKRDDQRIISKIEGRRGTIYQIYPLGDGVNCIESPTIELGLELEEFLKSKKK